MANIDEIQGSWFPTGFHGHFRSKTRNDFTIPYRQRAKPQPPVKFLNQTRERSNRHLFSKHDNRNAHSNIGDLEAFFNMGLGKKKFLSNTNQAAAGQHTKSTKDLMTWKGNENGAMVTTYRTHFDHRSLPTPGFNDYEPVHIRSNLHLQRRHFRAASAPPSQCRTAPLLAWNEPDQSFSAKPGIGSHHLREKQTFSHSTPARPGQELLEENSSLSALDSNTVFQESSSPLDDKCNATELDDYLEDDQIIGMDVRDNASALVHGGPRSSSPAFGKDHSYPRLFDLEDLNAGISELYKISPKDNSRSISLDNELDGLSFPDVPTHQTNDQSRIDGGSVVSCGSSHSLSKSYLYSSVSVGEDIPNFLQDDGDHLIPKFKANGKGFCWPMDKLPLGGDREFKEGVQWKIKELIGHGASAQCFLGCLIDNEDKQFCVKKCQYKEEEVRALCLAAKEIYAKKISEGARKIVSFYGATYYKPDVCIFMEYMKGGTVRDAIMEAEDDLDKNDCIQYFKDVLQALGFIHQKGIVHNDIKADNVLLTSSRLQAKLSDFGKASAISGHQQASEDVWSGGCFLLEMLGWKYSGALRSGFLKKSDVLTRLPPNIDRDTHDVLSRCFREDRDQCTALSVLRSNFFN